MAPLPTIRRISRLRDLAVFRDFTWSPDIPELRRLNLIYGFNGSGKTTLSRVFASLAEGSVHPKLPPRGSFDVELTDGRRIGSSDLPEGMGDRLLVFNKDFVDDNIRWKDGTANPVFYLGKDQADAAERLEGVEGEILELEPRLAAASDDVTQKERAFSQHKTAAARLIGEQLGEARTYRASNLSGDYEAGSYAESLQLTEEERGRVRGIVVQEAPLPKLGRLEVSEPDLAGLVSEVRDLLAKSLGTMVLEDLRKHDAMVKWVQEGLTYHRTHDVASCLLCGNALTEGRMKALDEAIDDRFDRLVAEVAATLARTDGADEQLGKLVRTVPSESDIIKNLHAGWREAGYKLQESVGAARTVLTALRAELQEKAKAPNVARDPSRLGTVEECQKLDAAVEKSLSTVNEIIDAHNDAHDEFESVRREAGDRLKKHFLAEGQATYRQLESELSDAKATFARLEEKRESLKTEAERLRTATRRHGPAADMINNMIRGYLGHDEIEIATREEGYELRRRGEQVAELLSEGEKTAIALCYFLSLVEAEGRRVDQLIVVVDDPISSLDTRALNYAFNVIRSALRGAGQLIVMTHNLHFMNEVKKWLKSENRGDPSASLLFLDVTQAEGRRERFASVRALPRLLQDYESEYHYLFHLVLRFRDSPDAEFGYLFLLPNALRKVLEIFLAFKVPGPDGLSSKVGNLVANDPHVDADRVRALNRLIQLESHADSLDDLVAFSSMTVEETMNAAAALLHLIETLDRGHYDRLCRICRA